MNSLTERVLKGMGTFSGPAQNTQFNQIVELIKASMPPFAASIQQNNIKNENGLNIIRSNIKNQPVFFSIFYAELG